MRKTKIVATLGPATDSEEMLQTLIATGVNVFRINMSHAPHEWVRTIIPRIREVASKLGKIVGILLDTQGPAIRTGDLASKLELKPGDTFTFTVRGHKSEETFSVDTNYDDLVKDIHVGDIVLVDNGVIRMVVREKNDKLLRCEVLTSGSMGSRRHINLPGVKVNLPALTEKDLADVKLGVECKVDMIALSFVREAGDIMQLRGILRAEHAEHIAIVAKIEDQSAVQNIDSIIASADGVMVARGDLGVECPYEELPIIQRRIVKKCVQIGKPVIVATHLLESMISNPMPTRAEITDVSNAIYEQADAVMLSGETTVGKYPVECVEVLHKVAKRVEPTGSIEFHHEVELTDERGDIVKSAVLLADQVQATGICVFTHKGVMPAMCAALRPRFSPVYAFTPSIELGRRLMLRYAVFPLIMPFSEQLDANIRSAEALLRDRGIVTAGSKLVIISDLVTQGETVCSLHLRTLH